MNEMPQKLLFRIRLVLLFFMLVLVLSGVTAFPLCWELKLLVAWFGEGTWWGTHIPGLADWLALVKEGLDHNAAHYPFIACGTDWLAFAHIMIAVAFLGPLRDPVKNSWVVHWGMLCCLGILPLSLIGGPIRGVPFGWQMIDCSFGIFGILPLIAVHYWTKQLERTQHETQSHA